MMIRRIIEILGLSLVTVTSTAVIAGELICKYESVARSVVAAHREDHVKFAELERQQLMRKMRHLVARKTTAQDAADTSSDQVKSQKTKELESMGQAKQIYDHLIVIEQRRGREIQLILDAVSFVELSHNENLQELTGQDARYQTAENIVSEIRKTFSNSEQALLDFKSSDICSLSESLKRRAVNYYETMHQEPDSRKAVRDFEYFSAKYGWPADEAELSPDEKTLYYEITVAIEAMFVKIQYVSNLYGLAVLDELSDARATSFRIDVVKTLENPDYSGSAWTENRHFTAEEYRLIEYLDSIDN